MTKTDIILSLCHEQDYTTISVLNQFPLDVLKSMHNECDFVFHAQTLGSGYLIQSLNGATSVLQYYDQYGSRMTKDRHRLVA